jgi:DNA invertase Pin-like site-specific DNA recombinase
MKRCAIYTRKSTEEGLDQSFNSLDAQRDACAAYIASQRHDGWGLVKAAYDDGGFSGGSMDRPALRQLLADIREGLVDIVVVYKIDRLTRSLADFAKMVEVFDAKGVSFVSVTQQFNTTTSMGRLTLNVLLSFAQFEREVTAERIRDKIAASRKKGMWMGGAPPLGYDVRDRKLVPNPEEARTVRRLFEAYLEVRSIKALARWTKDQGIVTKVRRDRDGKVRSGGRPFSTGNLHALLQYRTYIGEVSHKGAVYPGEHDAILPRDLWDRVQEHRRGAGTSRRTGVNAPPALPLTGLVFDETGDRLTPTHATKAGRRYYYYVSSRLQQDATSDPSGWRLPAGALEGSVAAALRSFLCDDQKLQDLQEKCDVDHGDRVHLLTQVLTRSRQLTERIQESNARDCLSALASLIRRIDLGPGLMTIRINATALLAMCRASAEAQDEGRQIHALQGADNFDYALTIPLSLRRRGVEARLILGDGKDARRAPDKVLIRCIAEARAWFEDLRTGAAGSVKQIAAREQLPASEVSRQLPLAFLAPAIITAILEGRQPVELTAKALKRIDLPLDWSEQSRRLGFARI